MSFDQFGVAVEEALETIPTDLRQRLDNLAVTIEDAPTREDLFDLGLDPEKETLFGIYQGVPLPDRDPSSYSELPDRIVIYRLPLLEACSSRRELLREIRDTVIHEVGHYFGFDDEALP
jgi:predicted Zn-dependent protease with MMP-like domain